MKDDVGSAEYSLGILPEVDSETVAGEIWWWCGECVGEGVVVGVGVSYRSNHCCKMSVAFL